MNRGLYDIFLIEKTIVKAPIEKKTRQSPSFPTISYWTGRKANPINTTAAPKASFSNKSFDSKNSWILFTLLFIFPILSFLTN